MFLRPVSAKVAVSGEFSVTVNAGWEGVHTWHSVCCPEVLVEVLLVAAGVVWAHLALVPLSRHVDVGGGVGVVGVVGVVVVWALQE